MQIDEMKSAWQALDRRLSQQHALNLEMFRDTRMGKLRSGLRPLVIGQAVQMLFGIALATWAVAFWVPHRGVLHLLVCGLLVQGFGLLMIMSSGEVLARIRKLDHGAPVAELQRRLAELRAWRVRVEAPVNALVGCFIWVPVLVMNLAWFGFDVWVRVPGFAFWAMASSVVGLGVVVLAVWLARHLGYGSKLDAHAAGSSVQKAETVLAEIARFEHE